MDRFETVRHVSVHPRRRRGPVAPDPLPIRDASWRVPGQIARRALPWFEEEDEGNEQAQCPMQGGEEGQGRHAGDKWGGAEPSQYEII